MLDRSKQETMGLRVRLFSKYLVTLLADNLI